MVETPHSAAAEVFSKQLKEGMRYAEEKEGHLYDPDRKFLGIMPASSQAMRGLIYGIWLAGVENYSKPIQGFLSARYTDLAKVLLGKSSLSSEALAAQHPRVKQGIAAAAVISTVGIAAAPFINDIFAGTSKLRKERAKMAGKMRPLLEEVTGKSGVHALMGVEHGDNEVLYVQRKRFEADFKQRLIDDLRMTSLSAAPTAVTSILRSNNISLNDKIGQFITGHASSAAKTGAEVVKEGGGKVTAMISFAAPQIGEILTEDSKRKYDAARTKHSALEMIVNLDEQLRDIDFSNEHFTDSFSLPGKGGSKSLAGYIAEVFKQHQRDMEKLNPEYTQLRKALDSQLEEISKDIAEAIKRGDIAPLALARLAGEGQVIKNKGRALAKPSEVRATIQKMAGSALNYLQVDSADYYGESSFSRRDLKEALSALEGEDKIIFASLVPDDILKEAGLSADQVKSIRDSSAKIYERKLSQIVTGLAGHDDQTLSDLGLAEEEIKQLRTVAKEVRAKGAESIHEFRAKPTDPAGIERVVTNAVVNRVQGNKEYLGSLIRRGQELIDAAPETAAIADNAAEADTKASSDSQHSKVLADTAHEADAEAPHDRVERAEKTSFASREESRRESPEEAEEIAL